MKSEIANMLTKAGRTLIAISLILALMFSLTACGKGKKSKENGGVEVDSATLSEKIVPPSYALTESTSESTLWASNYLATSNDLVYYIGSDSEQYYVCCFNPDTSDDRIIYPSGSRVFMDIAASPDGFIYVLTTSSIDDSVYEILKLDSTGSLIGDYSLAKINKNNQWTPEKIGYSGGKLFILSDQALMSTEISSEIKIKQTLQLEAVSQMSFTGDGNILLAYSRDGKFYLRLYSPEKLDLINSASFNMTFSSISGGQSWDVFLSDSNALYGYLFETNELKKLFSWNGIGILPGGVIESGGKLVCSGRFSFDKPNPLLVLEPREVSQESDSVIRFATTDPDGLDYIVQQAIRDWNNSNPQCPIEIIDYSVYNTTDKTAASTKLMADIISGNMPDIYDFSMSSIDTIPSSAQFARRGLLEDLYPYIDNDPELSREDFIPGVIKSLEISGGLYELVPEISWTTTFASTGVIGDDEENWTYDNFNSIIENSDYFDSIFDKRNDRIWLFGNLVDASGDKLVNWDTGECYFESDYFKNLLETAKQMPEKGEERKYDLLPDEVAANTGLLYYISFNDVWMASQCPQAFQGDYAFPGLPEIGNAISPQCSYGISAYSTNKEQCWQFLRQFLTKEYGDKFSIPVRVDSLKGRINEYWYGFSEETRQYHTYGLEAMNKMADILTNVDTVVRHDPQIWQIVYSESGAYFADQRSVEDTMKLIQSRVSIYMAEQY